MNRVVRWLRVLRLALVAFVLVSAGRSAHAQLGGGPMPRHFPHAAPTPPPSAAGPAHIRVTLEDGSRGPLTLAPRSGGYIGEFLVWNDGPGPLTVSRVATRGDEDDPRLPPRVNARFADGGGGSSVIQAHSSKRVRVTWIPDREPKLHEALGQIVLTSNDEAAGEVAMGFVSPLEGPLSFITAHLLTWLVVLPLLGALVALAMHLVAYQRAEHLRGILLGITALQSLLAILLYEGFSGIVTRVDGNDGFQFVERVVLVRSPGVEYFVGVDGMNVSLVLLTAILGFAAAIASFGVEGPLPRYYGFLALLLASVMGVFVALDLALLLSFWVVMLGALTGLTVAHGKPWTRATRKLGVYGALSALLLASASVALYLHSDASYLADGTRVAHTFAIPELMRVAYNAKHLTLLGCSWVKVVWVLLFLAFAIVTPLVPLHGWFIDVVGETPAPASVLLVGAVTKVGLYGFLRVSLGILPDGSRWAATTLVAFGVGTLAFSAISALRESDLVRLAAYAAVGQTGFCLVGLGGLTREGIAGCLLQMVSQGAVTATLFLLAFGVRQRAKTSALTALLERARALPLFAALVAITLLAAAGIPGSASFWAVLAIVLGAFPAQRLLTVLAVLAGALALGRHLLVIQSALRRPVESRTPRAARGKGATARVPVPAATPAPALADLDSRDLAALFPLLLIGLALAIHPAPFFTLIQGGVSDENQLVNPPGPDEIARVDVEMAGARRDPGSYSAFQELALVRD